MFKGVKETQAFDRERIHINVAKIKKFGKNFEIAVDPTLALNYKEGKNIDIKDVLKAEHIFHDIKQGEMAHETLLLQAFGTSDVLEVAKIILKDGLLQLSEEHRKQMIEEKRKKIVEIIHSNAIDPTTSLPHPVVRIENAMKEAKVHIDAHKKAEDQVQDVLKLLRPILPIKFAVKELQITIPGTYALKNYRAVHGYGRILKEEWLDDGAYLVTIEIPAGLQNDLIDDLNKRTHGDSDIKILKER